MNEDNIANSGIVTQLAVVHTMLPKVKELIDNQVAEIESLKLQLHTTLTNRDLRTYDGKLNMNNEPIAWMQVHHEDGKPTKFSKVQTWEDDIPLYTHPAKTLTDEEIKELSEEHLDMDWQTGVIEFARAILRKAQEK